MSAHNPPKYHFDNINFNANESVTSYRSICISIIDLNFLKFYVCDRLFENGFENFKNLNLYTTQVANNKMKNSAVTNQC